MLFDGNYPLNSAILAPCFFPNIECRQMLWRITMISGWNLKRIASLEAELSTNSPPKSEWRMGKRNSLRWQKSSKNFREILQTTIFF